MRATDELEGIEREQRRGKKVNNWLLSKALSSFLWRSTHTHTLSLRHVRSDLENIKVSNFPKAFSFYHLNCLSAPLCRFYSLLFQRNFLISTRCCLIAERTTNRYIIINKCTFSLSTVLAAKFTPKTQVKSINATTCKFLARSHWHTISEWFNDVSYCVNDMLSFEMLRLGSCCRCYLSNACKLKQPLDWHAIHLNNLIDRHQIVFAKKIFVFHLNGLH